MSLAIRFHAGRLYSATAIISEGSCREGSSPHVHLLAQAQRRMTQALLEPSGGTCRWERTAASRSCTTGGDIYSSGKLRFPSMPITPYMT